MAFPASDKQWHPSHLVPPVLTLVMAIVMLLPLGSNLAGSLMPHLAMISVFYWISRRPRLMSYEVCALVGLFLDLWMGGLLGLNMLLLILVRFFVMNQLKFYRGRSRFVHWGVFGLLSLSLFALSWLIVTVVMNDFVPLRPFIVQWLMTTVAFVPIALVFGWVRRLALP